MIDLIIRIISGIFIGIAWIFWFIFSHIIEWLWNLIQQLTIKAWMFIFWFAFLWYIASQV